MDAIHQRSAETVLITHPSHGPKRLPSWNIVREAPSVVDQFERLKWIKMIAMQKYWTAKYPFLKSNYNRKEVDQSIVEWIKNVEKPVDPYSDDPYNLPLPEQTEHEVESISNEPPENVALPPQTEHELRSLRNEQ